MGDEGRDQPRASGIAYIKVNERLKDLSTRVAPAAGVMARWEKVTPRRVPPFRQKRREQRVYVLRLQVDRCLVAAS